MAGKSRFGPELTEAEIYALVDKNTPGNIKDELCPLFFEPIPTAVVIAAYGSLQSQWCNDVLTD